MKIKYTGSNRSLAAYDYMVLTSDAWILGVYVDSDGTERRFDIAGTYHNDILENHVSI